MKGDAKEGQQAFDHLLEQSKRSPGAVQCGPGAAEGGPDGAGPEADRGGLREGAGEGQQAAARGARAEWSNDPADKLDWLKKADDSQPEVKYRVAGAEARQAEDQGKEQEAVWHLRQGLDVLARITPKTDETLAELGKFQLWIFRLTGDRAALDKGVELYEQALTKKPGDAAMLGNATDQFAGAACVDFVKGSIDPAVVREPAELRELFYLFNDRAGRDEQVNRTKKHPVLGGPGSWPVRRGEAEG